MNLECFLNSRYHDLVRKVEWLTFKPTYYVEDSLQNLMVRLDPRYFSELKTENEWMKLLKLSLIRQVWRDSKIDVRLKDKESQAALLDPDCIPFLSPMIGVEVRSSLTSDEIMLLRFLEDGDSKKIIAKKLGVSPSTVYKRIVSLRHTVLNHLGRT